MVKARLRHAQLSAPCIAKALAWPSHTLTCETWMRQSCGYQLPRLLVRLSAAKSRRSLSGAMSTARSAALAGHQQGFAECGPHQTQIMRASRLRWQHCPSSLFALLVRGLLSAPLCSCPADARLVSRLAGVSSALPAARAGHQQGSCSVWHSAFDDYEGKQTALAARTARPVHLPALFPSAEC